MTTVTFYLQQNVSGVVNVLTGTWVRLTNNSTAATFVSTAASDGNGLVTVNTVPAGSYTVATGPSAVGAWTNTGDNNFTVEATDAANLTTIPGNITLTAASTDIVPGATGVNFKNNANNKTQVGIPDSGLITLRNAIEVPPAQDTALPTHSYGTIPIKLDEQSTASGASLTLTVPSGGPFRALTIYFHGRSDQAGAQNLLMQFNGDAGTNYDYQDIVDTNATLAQGTGLAQTTGLIGTLTPSGAAAGSITGCVVEILNADSTTLRKSWFSRSGSQYTDAVANFVMVTLKGEWRNTANAITSILIKGGAGNLITARAVLIGIP